ncbi:MAG: hypothetical protein U0105_15085 [Candidatus Obscuribacterales bacterium]
MYPAYLIRSAIDWVRHDEKFKDSNPYSRCEETVKTCRELWQEQEGVAYTDMVEPNAVTAYWTEFFHAPDPLPDEHEWRDGLIKRSHQYDSFEDWAVWFKQQYARVYKDDYNWMGVLTAAWAHTHQYEVRYVEDNWDFQPALSYLPTSEMWRLEPHINTVSEVLTEVWNEELQHYKEIGFQFEDGPSPDFGRVECLGFDMKTMFTLWPPRSGRDKDLIEIGPMVADVVVPAGDDWYRKLDNVIFAHDYLDVTALINRANYVFGSRRRLMELMCDSPPAEAKMQASAEGWLISQLESVS